MKKLFKIKKNKNFLKIVILSILMISLTVGIVLVKQKQNINSDAAAGCKYNYDRESCANACSTSKQGGKSYKCKWNIKQDKCGESTKECDSGGQGQKITVCPTGSSCNMDKATMNVQMTNSYRCALPDGSAMVYCCKLGVTFNNVKDGCVIPL